MTQKDGLWDNFMAIWAGCLFGRYNKTAIWAGGGVGIAKRRAAGNARAFSQWVGGTAKFTGDAG